MKIEWRKCPCGDAVCKTMYPINMGTFYEGSGFEPEEAALIDQAFLALERQRDAKERS